MDPATLGALAALLSAGLWAWSSVLFLPLVKRHGAFACNLLKSGIAGLMLLITSYAINGEAFFGTMGQHDVVMLVLSGLVGMALGDYAYLAAIGKVGVRQATLLHSTNPLWLLMASLALGLEALTTWQIVGVLCITFGVLDVTRRRSSQAKKDAGQGRAHGRALPTSGILLGLLAALGQAAGILLSRDAAQLCSPLTSAALRLLAATLGLLLTALLSGRLKASLRIFADKESRLPALVPTFFGTYLGVMCMMMAIANLPEAVSGALLSLVPIFAIPISWWLLKEKVHRATLIGTCIAVAGVVLIVASPAFA